MDAGIQHLEGDSCQLGVDVGVDRILFGEAEVMDEAILARIFLRDESEWRDDDIGERYGGKWPGNVAFQLLFAELHPYEAWRTDLWLV